MDCMKINKYFKFNLTITIVETYPLMTIIVDTSYFYSIFSVPRGNEGTYNQFMCARRRRGYVLHRDENGHLIQNFKSSFKIFFAFLIKIFR